VSCFSASTAQSPGVDRGLLTLLKAPVCPVQVWDHNCMRAKSFAVMVEVTLPRTDHDVRGRRAYERLTGRWKGRVVVTCWTGAYVVSSTDLVVLGGLGARHDWTAVRPQAGGRGGEDLLCTGPPALLTSNTNCRRSCAERRQPHTPGLHALPSDEVMGCDSLNCWASDGGELLCGQRVPAA